VARVKRIATEVVTQTVGAGKAVMGEARAMGERVGEAATNLVEKVT
jgi:hypothetical protein